jgi:uncharacterized repeat protein (TIGR03803 family)
MKSKSIQSSLNYALVVIAATLVFVSGAEAASKYKMLHEFLDKPAMDSSAALVADSAGNLYGTARYSIDGGCNAGQGCGVVFKLARQSSGKWAYSVIHRFTGPDGEQPTASLILDSSGNLYGTTQLGGANAVGTVFELSPSGTAWKEKVLYSFAGSGDLFYPSAALTFDASGNLYGTASSGGSFGHGGVFELKPSGDAWQETILYSFTGGADGGNPFNSLVWDSAGNLYSTANGGGEYASGVVFELTPSSGGTWTETVLHSFNINLGPLNGVILDAAGNLYGTTGAGTVFELTPSTHKWTFKVLHRLNEPSYAGVTIDPAGNVYGEAFSGGGGYGLVFKLSQSDGKWKETVLHSFGNTDGANPQGGLIFDQKGVLYGTTPGGGTGYGVVFSLTP